MSTAAAQYDNAQQPAADESRTALPLRSDTFLGVCEAIGQDLGFNPNFLRIPFAALILWNPMMIIAIYLGLGCVVAASRWFFPTKPNAASQASDDAAADNEDDSEERLAA